MEYIYILVFFFFFFFFHYIFSMTGVANMFGLDMIMIRVGGWDILVEWASIVSVLIIGGIKIIKALELAYPYP